MKKITNTGSMYQSEGIFYCQFETFLRFT